MLCPQLFGTTCQAQHLRFNHFWVAISELFKRIKIWRSILEQTPNTTMPPSSWEGREEKLDNREFRGK